MEHLNDAVSMADISGQGSLPDYERPPVVETVVGVQFDRLPSIQNAHFAAFWMNLDRGEWPTVVDAPLLPSQSERFDATGGWARGIQFQLTQNEGCRLQIRNRDGDRMIQLQNGRLHFNWLGKGGGSYPRYENVRREFAAVWEQFVGFLLAENLGEILPNQWEVTYVNQIPRGTVWNRPADWEFFRPLCAMPSIGGVIEGESFGGEWHFVIPPQRGRLHIAWQHGREVSDKIEGGPQEFVRMTLTARGPVERNVDAARAMLGGLDLGRATIVHSFRKLMSDDANRFWGLKHEGND